MPWYAVVQSLNPITYDLRKYSPEGPGPNLGNILMPSPLHSQPVLVTFSNGSVALISSDVSGVIDRIVPVIGQFSASANMLYPVSVVTVHLPHIHRQDALTDRITYLIQTKQSMGHYYQ